MKNIILPIVMALFLVLQLDVYASKEVSATLDSTINNSINGQANLENKSGSATQQKTNLVALMTSSGFAVYGVSKGNRICVYDDKGTKVAQAKVRSNFIEIGLKGGGVFVVEVNDGNRTHRFKIAK